MLSPISQEGESVSQFDADLTKALEQKEAELKSLAAENERLRRLFDAAAAGHT